MGLFADKADMKTVNFLARRVLQTRGQAIMEYVLILAVVVVIGGTALWKLNKGFGDWGKSLFGGADPFVPCLLQTGSLPSIPHSACHNSFDMENMDLANIGGSGGAGAGGDSTTDDNSGGSGGSDSNSNNKDSGDNSSESYSSSDSSSSGSGNTSRSKKNGKKSRSSPRGDLMATTSEGGGSATKNQALSGKSEKSGNIIRRGRKKKKMGFRNDSSIAGGGGSSGQRFKALHSYGRMDSEREEQRKRAIPLMAGGAGGKKNKSQGKEKKSRFVVEKKLKIKAKDIDVGGWSFGNIFRVILIICIISAIVLLVASQTRQVQKSMK